MLPPACPNSRGKSELVGCLIQCCSPTSCRLFAGYSTDAVPASLKRLLQPTGASLPASQRLLLLGLGRIPALHCHAMHFQVQAGIACAQHEACSLRSPARPAGSLAPLLHAFQFIADLGSHEVVDGDLIHIFWQASPGKACACFCQPRCCIAGRAVF